jgi:hypothetical protein
MRKTMLHREEGKSNVGKTARLSGVITISLALFLSTSMTIIHSSEDEE